MYTLVPGDKVVIHNGYEAPAHLEGKTLIVKSFPFNVCGSMCVTLEKQHGVYAVDGLKKVIKPECPVEPASPKVQVASTPKLLPCPICGGKLKTHGPDDWKPSFCDPDSGGDPYAFYCDCGYCFDSNSYDYNEAVVKANRRAGKAK